jgi:hypothetical protein
MKADGLGIDQRARIFRALALFAIGLLARRVFGNPPFDSDPSCRAPNILLQVEKARADVRQSRSAASSVGLASGPVRPSLTAEANGIGSELLLRMRGEVGANYQLLTATNINGPWSPARGFLLIEPEALWIDTVTDQASTRFYRLSVPTALEMEPSLPTSGCSTSRESPTNSITIPTARQWRLLPQENGSRTWQICCPS